jgi:hypothetical protein
VVDVLWYISERTDPRTVNEVAPRAVGERKMMSSAFPTPARSAKTHSSSPTCLSSTNETLSSSGLNTTLQTGHLGTSRFLVHGVDAALANGVLGGAEKGRAVQDEVADCPRKESELQRGSEWRRGVLGQLSQCGAASRNRARGRPGIWKVAEWSAEEEKSFV